MCLMIRVVVVGVCCLLVHAVPDPQAVIDALMDESLRSNRVQACDGERVTLQCPKNTHIQVETGFYGRVVPVSQLCPEREGRPSARPFYDSTCDVIHAQSRLSELCDKRRKCTIYVDASTFEEDPCPSTSKYLQMSYKCRPVSFDGESFCADSEMQLECREGKRVAVYSAVYGRTSRGQPPHCPAPPKRLLSTDCTRDVLGKVVSRCHAQRQCSLSVTDHFFGRACPPSLPAYLHIIFMCVNEEVFSEEAIKGELPSQITLKEYHEGSGSSFEESDIFTDGSHELSHDEGYHNFDQKTHVEDDDEPLLMATEGTSSSHRDTSAAVNDASFIERTTPTPTEPPAIPDQHLVGANAIGIGHDLVMIWRFLRENKEKVLLCAVLSLSVALILLVLACILQQFCSPSKDSRVRYSIESSTLVHSQQVERKNSLMEMSDLPDDPFLRYSMSPRSLHYDFT